MKFLQGKPLHVRRRIAIIWTGIIGIALILIMIYAYAHPAHADHDPEQGIMSGYTILLQKIQSLFHHK